MTWPYGFNISLYSFNTQFGVLRLRSNRSNRQTICRLSGGETLLMPETPNETLLSSFPLAWRWTDPRYHALPPESLARIRPLDEGAAENAWKTSSRLASDDALDPFRPNAHLFCQITELDTGDEDEHIVDMWLKDRLPKLPIDVIVSWQPTIAVVTDTEIFMQYWSSFCYPASDDVSI